MSPAAAPHLLASLFRGSGTTGHGNQSANFSGNRIQVNAALGFRTHQTVVQAADDNVPLGASIALAASVGFAAGLAASQIIKKPSVTPLEAVTPAGRLVARGIAKDVMGMQ